MDLSYALTNLNRVKHFLKFDSSNTDNDYFLEFLIGTASALVENYCHRKFVLRTYTDEKYNGDGTNRVCLNAMPIKSVTSLYDDPSRDYTANELFASTDYWINSQQGFIELFANSSKGSVFNDSQQNIKVTYEGGYSKFTVLTGVTDRLVIKEDGGNVKIYVTVGEYTVDDFITMLVNLLNADDDLANKYNLTYFPNTGKFQLDADGNFTIVNTAEQALNRNVMQMMGYDVSADSTEAATLTSDYYVAGIPQDLEYATLLIIKELYDDTIYGKNRFNIKSKSTNDGPQKVMTSYLTDLLPDRIMSILNYYKVIMA